MSFSSDVIKRLTRIDIESNDELKAAYLYAAILSNMSLVFHGLGRFNLKFEFTDSDCVKSIFTLIRDLFGYRAVLSVSDVSSFGHHKVYTCTVDDSEKSFEILSYFEMSDGMGIANAEHHINTELLRQDEETIAFIRACFIFSGYVADPKKRYFAEVRFSHEATANDYLKMIESLSVSGKVRQKGSGYVVYMSSYKSIERFLGLVGDSQGYLEFNDASIIKEMLNDSQRAANCDIANALKTKNASIDQVRAIEKIISSGKMSKLSEPLLEAAKMRLDNPDLTLNELCQKFDPPLKKTTLSNRLKRLIQISNDL